MFVKLEDTIPVPFGINGSTGSVDADVPPTYKVFEEDSIVELTLAGDSLVHVTTGHYVVMLPCTTANGFESDKWYYVVVYATVEGISDKLPLSAFQIKDIADDVWDEELTAATHNITTSAGRRVRQLAAAVIIDGTCAGAGANGNQIVLDGDASAVDGAYDPALIFLTDGAGAGQCRLILQYDGATKTATVDRDWRVTPDGTSKYVITSDAGREHVNEGLAQSGSANTITLNANASPFDNAYVGQTVFLRSGLGEDQAARVTAYNGTTKVATVCKNWDVVPDGTTAYVMLPTAVLIPSILAAALIANDVASGTELTAMEARLSTRIANIAAGGAIDISTEYDALSFVPRTVVAGDNVVIALQLLQDGTAVDITDFDFYYGVKDDTSDSAYKIGPITGVITDASAGKFAFTLSALHTSIAAFAGVEQYIKIDSNGNKTTLTPPEGVRFILKERIVDEPTP